MISKSRTDYFWEATSSATTNALACSGSCSCPSPSSSPSWFGTRFCRQHLRITRNINAVKQYHISCKNQELRNWLPLKQSPGQCNYCNNSIKLPAKIRVLTLDMFQKAVTAEAATIFLWEQASHASITRHLVKSTVTLNKLKFQQFLKTAHYIWIIFVDSLYLFGLSDWNSVNIIWALWNQWKTLLKFTNQQPYS